MFILPADLPTFEILGLHLAFLKPLRMISFIIS
jgi:hypothetical protein